MSGEIDAPQSVVIAAAKALPADAPPERVLAAIESISNRETTGKAREIRAALRPAARLPLHPAWDRDVPRLEVA